LARTLGVELFGDYSLIFAIFAYVSLLANFGFETYGTIEVAKVKSIEIINSVIVLRTIYALVLLLIVILLHLYFDVSRSLLLLLQSGSILLLPFSFQFALRAIDQMQWVGWQRFIQSGVFLVLVYLVIDHHSLMKIPVLWFASSGISLIPLIVVMRKKFNHKFFIPRFDVIKAVFIGSASIGISSALILIYLNFDTILLGVFLNSYSVGIYSAAFKIYYAGYAMLGLYYMAFLPTLSRVSAQSFGAKSIYIRLLMIIGLVTAVAGYIEAEPLIRILFGTEFLAAVTSLKILFAALGIACMNFAFMNPLQAIGKQKVFNVILLIRTLIFLIVCVVLIPPYGIEGAAVSTLLAEILTVFLSYHEFSKVFNHKSI
jgi:O-antigen/teichoic acid export membrane protein